MSIFIRRYRNFSIFPFLVINDLDYLHSVEFSISSIWNARLILAPNNNEPRTYLMHACMTWYILISLLVKYIQQALGLGFKDLCLLELKTAQPTWWRWRWRCRCRTNRWSKYELFRIVINCHKFNLLRKLGWRSCLLITYMPSTFEEWRRDGDAIYAKYMQMEMEFCSTDEGN